ncbi:MAG TPA: preprotein translocase subunit YajC [Acidimicrobiales bacterium]|jgi:preprotein translocase subunit YajC|nr:preprotein translocase subunit YajC [Acidimicrobiales bacterium]
MTPTLVALATPFLDAAAKKTSSSSLVTFLPIIVIAVAAYFFFLRPQQQKAKRAREQVQQYEVGNEVLTAGGIVGHIIDIEDDRVTLETSVGASFVVLRPYILRRLDIEPAGEPGADERHEDDDDGYDDEYDEYDESESGEDEADEGDEGDDHQRGGGNGKNRGDDRGPSTSR